MFLAFAAILIDLSMAQVFTLQVDQLEQTKSDHWTTYAYPKPDNPDDHLWAFTVDPLGRVWVGSGNNGLSMLNPDGTWKTYTTKNSELASNGITALASDETGNIAIGSREGISMLSPDETWVSFTGSELPPELSKFTFPFSMAIDGQAQIWAGGVSYPNELYMLPGDGNWLTYVLPDSYNIEVKALAVDQQNRVWAGGLWTGLHMLDNEGNWTTIPISDPNGDDRPVSVLDLAIDKQGRVWVAGWLSGLLAVNPDKTWTSYISYKSADTEVKFINVDYVAIDGRENVWIVNTSTFDESGSTYISELTPDGHWNTYSPRFSGLPDDKIIGLGIDNQDRVWIGHYNGVTVFDRPSVPEPQVEPSEKINSQYANITKARVIALGLVMVMVISFLYARAIINFSALILFIKGFFGWFILNTILYLFQSAFNVLASNLCNDTAALGCVIVILIGITIFVFTVNIGIALFLFRKNLWAGFWGFVTAFVINAIILFMLGQLGLGIVNLVFYYILTPFFL